jgi:hypothetical protein
MTCIQPSEKSPTLVVEEEGYFHCAGLGNKLGICPYYVVGITLQLPILVDSPRDTAVYSSSAGNDIQRPAWQPLLFMATRFHVICHKYTPKTPLRSPSQK